MFKRTVMATSVALAITALPAVAQEEEGSFLDEWEIAGELKNESAVFTEDGTTIGAASAHDTGDVMKFENTARIFINGLVGESSEFHAELRPVRDGEAVDGMKGHENYTQQDFLREIYVDTAVGEDDDVSLRIGKQQVVWGTADGMKLLDIINPTDYREMAQNAMEDSRVPVWMINAETDLEDGANLQAVLSQARENVFAGLDRKINTNIRRNNTATLADETSSNGHQRGSAFIMKGVDTITGETDGFLNGVPDLGGMAARFWGGFGGGANLYGGGSGITVGDYAGNPAVAGMPPGFDGDGAQIINGIASANYNFNLSDAADSTEWSAATNPNSMFEYMDRTMFSTFDAFVSAGSQYKYDMPDNPVDIAFRLKNSTDDGVNYSANYSYNYDKNPVINLSWKNTNGEELRVNYDNTSDWGGGLGGQAAAGRDSAILTLVDPDGVITYGGSQGNGGNAILQFEQTLKRAHNLGGSFDASVDTESLGTVVLRGEALYQNDVYSPVFNRGKLAVGDLVGALKMEKGDRFKYVLGADITVMTNMMVSAQFIQDRNLDYVDNNVDWDGTACTAADGVNCGVYTADFATMHMSNNFQKAEENKEFYSFFMSKPFGNEQQHRWNNIFMYEENGGKWNRFDVEYSFSDELIGMFEYDKYWGDENTQFGQLEASSNATLGLKYIF